MNFYKLTLLKSVKKFEHYINARLKGAETDKQKKVILDTIAKNELFHAFGGLYTPTDISKRLYVLYGLTELLEWYEGDNMTPEEIEQDSKTYEQFDLDFKYTPLDARRVIIMALNHHKRVLEISIEELEALELQANVDTVKE